MHPFSPLYGFLMFTGGKERNKWIHDFFPSFRNWIYDLPPFKIKLVIQIVIFHFTLFSLFGYQVFSLS